MNQKKLMDFLPCLSFKKELFCTESFKLPRDTRMTNPKKYVVKTWLRWSVLDTNLFNSIGTEEKREKIDNVQI